MPIAANDGDEGNAVEAPAEDRAEREAPRRGRPRREARPVESNEGETFDAALLPPSLGISVGDERRRSPQAAPRPPAPLAGRRSCRIIARLIEYRKGRRATGALFR